MFAKILALAVVSIFSFAVASGTNMAAMLMLPVFVIASLWLYFLPSIEAYRRKHENTQSILIVNLFFGWTLIGWVFSLVWAIKNPSKVTPVVASIGDENNDAEQLKVCPFCAELIKRSAIKCKHCGSDLSS